MGNKCSCINFLVNNKESNLANKQQGLNNNKSSRNNSNNFKEIIKSDYNLKNSESTNKDSLQRNNINININNINKIINNYDNNNKGNNTKSNLKKKNTIYLKTLIVSFIKGYILRKKFNNYLKEELRKHGKDLYEQYLKITTNKKPTQILENTNNDTQISKYLATSWTEFYEEDPTKEINSKISKTKKYSNGIIFKYKSNNFHSVNISECLDCAKYCYRGEVDLYTNKKCGKGEIIYSDGSRARGTFYNDEFNGWNTLIDVEGIIFVGLFDKLGLNGKGLRYNTEANHIYRGDFLNSLRHGYGTDCTNNSKYEGEFRKDKKCGKGKIKFESGDTYEGDFNDNKFNGYGHYKWFKNGHEYKGNYLNGKFHGEGFYQWEENEYYNGEYVNGVKEGEGEISYSDGKKFFVNFTNGKPNGIGVFQDKDGNRCEVEFINGKLNKKYKKK